MDVPRGAIATDGLERAGRSRSGTGVVARVYLPALPTSKASLERKERHRQNADEEKALGGGWADAPDAFDAFKGARRPRTDEQNPLKWLDAWSVPGLLSEHRKKIRAELLRADAAFERSNDSDPESAALPSMRQAFDGIARVLFEAGILTEDLLRKDVQQLVWDSAIAGGWWRRASETCQDIFPEPLGHYWVWRDDSRDWKGLFRAEAREWEARLLESPSREIPDAAIVSIEAGSSGPAEEGGDFGSEAQRIAALAAYKKMWGCSEAGLARAANVDPADLSKWKKNRLPVVSDKKARIERVLKNNEKPVPAAKRARDS